LLSITGFYGLTDRFHRLAMPRWAKPAIGGLLVGCIALVLPAVLGTGYGYVQQGMERQPLLAIPVWIIVLLPFAKILATSLSIGSGGSGGIFGPGMVIGGLLGAGMWRLLEPTAPAIPVDPAPFAMVGMMALFGSVAHAPLAVMLMVAEMTGNLPMLAPATPPARPGHSCAPTTSPRASRRSPRTTASTMRSARSPTFAATGHLSSQAVDRRVCCRSATRSPRTARH